MQNRAPTKKESLLILNKKNFKIGSIIDVGMMSGTYQLMTTMSNKPQLLIEPIVEWNEILIPKYKKEGIDFKIVNIALSDFNGSMNMQLKSHREGMKITHARLTTKSHGNDLREVPVRTLDSLMIEYSYFMPEPYLLKIDVDGSEEEILKGSTDVLKRTSVVIVEMNTKNFFQRFQILKENSFEIFDIVDLCYYDGQLRAFDAVFISSKYTPKKTMYDEGFDINKYYQYLH